MRLNCSRVIYLFSILNSSRAPFSLKFFLLLFLLFGGRAEALRDLGPFVEAAENSFVDMMMALTAPAFAGPGAELAEQQFREAWAPQIRAELERQTPGNDPIKVADAIGTHLRFAWEVYRYFVDELRVPEDPTVENGEVLIGLKAHIRQAESAFLMIRREGASSSVTLMRDPNTGLGLSTEQVQRLAQTDFKPFYIAVTGNRQWGKEYTGTEGLAVLGLAQAIRGYRKFMTQEGTITLFMRDPVNFYHQINDVEGRQINEEVHRRYGIDLRVNDFAGQLGSKGMPYLFRFISHGEFSELLDRLEARGYVLNNAAMVERLQNNALGFLFGKRFQTGQTILRARPLEMIARHLTYLPRKVGGEILSMRSAPLHWDVEALNCIHFSNTDANLTLLGNTLAAWLPQAKNFYEAVRSRTIHLVRLIKNSDGQLILHRLSDLPPARFEQALNVIVESLKEGDLENFVFNELGEKLTVLNQIFADWENPSDARQAQSALREKLVEAFPELQSCGRRLSKERRKKVLTSKKVP
jgi:hypothetical protein